MNKKKLILPIDENLIDIVDAATERVWALKIDEGLYRLTNIPFYSSGFAIDDEIYVDDISRVISPLDIVLHSENSTVLVISHNKEHWERVGDLVKSKDFLMERHLPRLSTAISVSNYFDFINQLEGLDKVQKSWTILMCNRRI